MQIIIEPTKEIDREIIAQIRENSPREGLKSSLRENEPRDIRVHFAQNNISCYMMDNEKLVAYAAAGCDHLFNGNMASAMGMNPNNTAIVMYLFTVPEYQRNGYAKQIIDTIALYVKKHFPMVQNLIRTTNSEENKELYIHYGAQLQETDQENRFLHTAKINNDYFFTYAI